MIRHSFTWKLIYDSRYKSKITSLSIFGQWGFVLAITEKTWRKSKKKSNCKIQDLLHIENNERPHNEMYFWTSGMLSLFLFLSTGALSVFGQHNSVPQIEPRGVVEGFRRNQNQTKPAPLKLNQGGVSSKVAVGTKTKPASHPPTSHRALFSRKLPKYFVGRKIFFHRENCGCSDCSEFGFHWRLTQVSLSFAWDTVHTNNHKKNKWQRWMPNFQIIPIAVYHNIKNYQCFLHFIALIL